MKKDNELVPSFMSTVKCWHTEGRRGYKVLEIVRTGELYDKHCTLLSSSEAGQEAGRLMELVK